MLIFLFLFRFVEQLTLLWQEGAWASSYKAHVDEAVCRYLDVAQLHILFYHQFLGEAHLPCGVEAAVLSSEKFDLVLLVAQDLICYFLL